METRRRRRCQRVRGDLRAPRSRRTGLLPVADRRPCVLRRRHFDRVPRSLATAGRHGAHDEHRTPPRGPAKISRKGATDGSGGRLVGSRGRVRARERLRLGRVIDRMAGAERAAVRISAVDDEQVEGVDAVLRMSGGCSRRGVTRRPETLTLRTCQSASCSARWRRLRDVAGRSLPGRQRWSLRRP